MPREPFFIDVADRRLFAILHRPDAAAAPRKIAVWFAPFAEEMNRARRMTTLLGESLASHGHALLVFDYSGTGDSGGEFAEARWDRWLDDAAAAGRWAQETFAAPISAIGLRLGCHLAIQDAARHPDRFERLVLWQPVTAGRTFLTQFLRQRTVAALSAGRDGESTDQLFRMLEAGETIEVGGYELNCALARDIGALRLAEYTPPAPRVSWLELSASGSLSPASGKIVDRWSGAGASVEATALEGPAFWSIQETTTAPALIAASLNALESGA